MSKSTNSHALMTSRAPIYVGVAALVAVAIGAVWAYPTFFSSALREERRVIADFEKLSAVDVKYDEHGAAIQLRANSPAINDATAIQLAKLRSLRRIDLNQCEVSDQTLQAIAELPELRALYLERTAVTSAGVAALESCQNLEELMLADCPIDDQALETIGKLPQLSLLSLSRTPITDAGMAHLHEMPNLRTLYLRGSAVAGQGFAHLKGSPELELIDFSDSSLDLNAIQTLQAFPKLDRLFLGRTPLDDRLLAELIDTLIRYNSRSEER
ncbi:MAG: hypothetical protein ACIALR_02010, partial [Blastopirellula sp. JB062]